ncbi:CBO0543 family protein [Lentibacillus sediminis]|uniref:CBO0543 family protein n=1 Tax=Lentibacillus sediminis TaxID=1940529 RepID=UPI000C1C7B41|nr:CBO0543 family protein [Lentibacillus sediminis]
MKGDKVSKFILRGSLIFTLICLPIFLLRKKPSIKDWLLAYLFNGITNGFIDNVLASHKLLQYPVRYLPKTFKSNVLFDFLVYPTFTVFFNQLTDKDKPKTILLKLLAFTVPTTLFEYLIEKNTNLLKWNKKWKWYHTLISMTLKSLVTRGVVGCVRKISDKQNK